MDEYKVIVCENSVVIVDESDKYYMLLVIALFKTLQHSEDASSVYCKLVDYLQ